MYLTHEFHFSPRPNRANEIALADLERRRFDRRGAKTSRFCWRFPPSGATGATSWTKRHTPMPALSTRSTSDYVPVRVDNDRRPDVNARYNQGGWPTTAFLTPDGALLAGATYLPPEQMRQRARRRSREFYRNESRRRSKSAPRRSVRASARVRRREPASRLCRNDDRARAGRDFEEAYDEEYGGFGDAPKFPMVDVLELLLQEYRVTREQRCTTCSHVRCWQWAAAVCTITPKAAFSAIRRHATGRFPISRR